MPNLVVVGGGVAGLTAARTASLRGLKVLTVSKGSPTDTATQYAQGGIAVVDDLNRAALADAEQTVTVAAPDLEDAALTLTATALVDVAVSRTESRGCHTRTDYPETDPNQRRSTRIKMGADGALEIPDMLLTGVH
ncbi:FAD-dependent oxidoreductase [Rhodococcus baikonurensis]|jgi:L-aspartate oxidase|uniref:L-aspartate oxidase n=1 Tax=Rhodococcus baikonurensis TaxID=172041 RepID=A0ABV5XKY7_9NOCA